MKHFQNHGTLIILAILSSMVIPVVAETENVVFDMKFASRERADSGPQIPIAYHLGKEIKADNPFIQAVKNQTENPIYIYQVPFEQKPLDFVFEYKDKALVAGYFDANHNGRLDENEKITKIQSRTGCRGKEQDIVFPVTEVNDIPVQLMFKVIFGSRDEILVHWNFASYYKGSAEIDGKEMIFLLFSGIRKIGYEDFMKSRFLLMSPDEFKTDIIRQPDGLSKLIFVGSNKFFYNLKFDKTKDKFSVILIPDTQPLVKLNFKIDSVPSCNIDFQNIRVYNLDSKDILMNLTSNHTSLPAGRYLINPAFMDYGTDERYFTAFIINNLKIGNNKTQTINLSKPEINLTILPESAKYRWTIQDLCKKFESPEYFKAGEKMRINATVIGNPEIIYFAFHKYKNKCAKENGCCRKTLSRNITIYDSGHATVFTNVLRPKGASSEITWQPEKPGEYKIVVTQDTGRLGEVITAEKHITVK